MATEDGRLHPFDESDGSPKTPRAGDAGREPELLPADWPTPVTWGAALGAGGEVLADAPDLVPMGKATGAGADQAPQGTVQAERRRPRSPLAAAPCRPRRRSRAVRAPSLGAVLSAGAVLGLVGLAGLVVLVLFSSGGWAPASPNEPTSAASSPPPRARVDLADLAMASRTLEARMRETARARHRAVVRHQREVARQRAHASHPAPELVTRAVTTPVATPTPASDSPFAPTVTPAERALTPGPWNLS